MGSRFRSQGWSSVMTVGKDEVDEAASRARFVGRVCS